MQHIPFRLIGIGSRPVRAMKMLKVNGISHFLEHMVFKGTKDRTAAEIARQMDSIGGNMDAFTAKECICFNVKVLDEHMPMALDVLSDLVLNPVFDATDIIREQGVILEEIKMDEDNPDYLVHEIFTQKFWKDHPLGKPISVPKRPCAASSSPSLDEDAAALFFADNLIISAGGQSGSRAICRAS